MAAPSDRPGDAGARRKALMEAITSFYSARQCGSVDDFISYFAPDARLSIPGNPVLNPGAGLRIGRDSIARYMHHLRDENIYLDHGVDHVVIEGDMVAVRWHTVVKIAANGREARFEVLDHLRIRDSQIVEMTHFYDTGTVALFKNRVALA
jgi:ketosteroid isomerase-like protein